MSRLLAFVIVLSEAHNMMTARMVGNLPLPSVLLIGWLVSAAAGAERPARAIPDAATTRDRFLKLLDRPCPPLNPREQPVVFEQGLQEIRFDFASEANQRVTGILVKLEMAVGRIPAVFILHGTGGSKESLRPVLRRFASHGFVAVAIDARYSGERSGGGKGGETYRAEIFKTWQSGQAFPFLYDTVWDTMRLIDYLETRADIDPKRIAGIGFSKGGIELYLAAAADTRIAAAVPCIGVQSFAWALEHDAWHSRVGTIQSAVDLAAAEEGVKSIDAAFVRRFYDRVVPGIENEFDGPVMLPLIAPRHLLVINGDSDDRTPRPGLELCVEAARVAFDRASASDRFEFILQPNTGHAVTPRSQEYTLDWLSRRLLNRESVSK
jgi:dienelactone hydrolase